MVTALGAAGAGACSGDSRPPAGGSASGASNASGVTGGGGSSSDAGGAAGASGASTSAGMAGQAGAPGAGGQGAEPPDSSGCGDGQLSFAEECEPGVEVVASCSSVGFETGVLRCASDCRFDKSDCRGSESCVDGRDNDGDGRVDCLDADCEGACADACVLPAVLADGSSLTASTEGRASSLTSSCANGGGAEIVFEVTADVTGKLEAWVSARGLVALSLRTACQDDASEVACALVDEAGGLTVDVTSGETLFAVVEDYAGVAAGNVTLEVASRATNVCGDGFVDESEECDDGAQAGGDGCSGACEVEVTENEPNDSADDAEPYLDPTYAFISPEGDVDYFSLVIEGGPRAVTLDVLDVGSGSCGALTMDPHLQLFDDARELVLEDDDAGEGYCARLVAPSLDDGEYVMVVRESPSATAATRPSFGYELRVSIQ